jgi:hypothetical protein
MLLLLLFAAAAAAAAAAASASAKMHVSCYTTQSYCRRTTSAYFRPLAHLISLIAFALNLLCLVYSSVAMNTIHATNRVNELELETVP